MGLTYAHSFLRSHISNKEGMMILVRSEEKAEVLRAANVGTIYTNPKDCLKEADLVIFAVKPQDSDVLFQSLKGHIDPQQVFLSIMAGVKITTIEAALGAKKIIRCMPNLPSQIGRGMTAFTSSDDVTRIELVMVQNLLNTTGKTVYVEKEEAIDGATAISGSGPAYVWHFMNEMLSAAQEMGFTYSEAELLVTQTFLGAVELYNASDISLEEWIKRVCSKGGTTEAALRSFRENEVGKDIHAGANAALQRAKELGGEGS